jgi:amidohydrolase
MDALPVTEQNCHEYVSVHEGRMHACGHDGHTAILLMVAELLRRHQATLPGKVVLLFQPAEEGAGGAVRVLEDGLIEKFSPDFCGGLHLWSDAPTGSLLATDGPFMASMDRFDITVTGRGGHGAIPQSTRDPVVAAAQLVLNLQSIVSRRVDPLEAAVLTVGSIHGGEAFNVIPDKVTLSGTVRTFSKATQANIEEWVRNHAEAQAKASDLAIDVSYQTSAFPTANAAKQCSWFRDVGKEIDGISHIRTDFRTMGSEDMSYLLDNIPGAYVFVGAGNPDVGAMYPHHHPKFEIDEAALQIGAELLFRYVYRAAEGSELGD